MRTRVYDIASSRKDRSICLFPSVEHTGFPVSGSATNNRNAVPLVTCASNHSAIQSLHPSVLGEIQNLIETDDSCHMPSKQRKAPELEDGVLASLTDTNKPLKCRKIISTLRDGHTGTRASCRTIGRKRVVGMDGKSKPSDLTSPSPVVSSPASSFALFDGDSPQERLLLVSTMPSTPVTRMLWTTNEPMDCHGDSTLETLPLDVLVRIVCCLQHDELKPLFHVCKRLRTVVLIARQTHFNYLTPDRDHQRKCGLSTPWPGRRWLSCSGTEIQALIRPPTPGAPKHLTRLGQARIAVPEMRQIAATLFQDTPPSANTGPSQHHSDYSGAESPCDLFCEEQLCQAVAQNTI